MAGSSFLRRVLLRIPSSAAVSRCDRARDSNCYDRRTQFTTAVASDSVVTGETDKKKEGKWLTLPLFTSTIDGSALGKEISGRRWADIPSTTSALKWVMKCCPQLPSSLVHKLFRLRQVQSESFNISSSNVGVQAQKRRVKRYWKLAAKDSMEFGDRIFLPNIVQELPSEKTECRCNEEEQKFVHSLELYKDLAIIVVNKPPGMPVQGGIGIKRSLDELAGTYLKHDYSESPRLLGIYLVHRLDRDSSGILVMGRTQLSATFLHSIFREKTSRASNEVHGSNTYGKPASYTWLELCPRTGRKHQLRVHCAEVLGTSIVGDSKYGWQAHRKHFPFSDLEQKLNEKPLKHKTLSFGLDLEHGSISGKQPQLHLHCKEMVLPDLSVALDHAQR